MSIPHPSWSAPGLSFGRTVAVEGMVPSYQIVLWQEEGLDQVEVQIEVTQQIFSDQISAMERLRSKLFL